MEEVDKVLEALSVVERYEEYLFRRAWGQALVVIGTVFPLGMFVLMNADILAVLTGTNADVVRLYANILTIVLCWGLVTYSFFNAWRTIRREPDQESGGILHAPLIAIIWFVSFFLTSLAPAELALVSVLWAASVSCLLSFVILHLTHSHDQEVVLLYLGVVLGFGSSLILAFQDAAVSGVVVPLLFSACFIIAGLTMHRRASESLKAKQ
ncbi:MAG: hypothetical protein EAX81_07375 [Candidatus Thorarchaeota archaeon]|nr:hypothetical protein [Candidatus Thorarchaeota archaeon]